MSPQSYQVDIIALTSTYDATGCWLEAIAEICRAAPQPRRVAA